MGHETYLRKQEVARCRSKESYRTGHYRRQEVRVKGKGSE